MKTTDLATYKNLEIKVSKACLNILTKLHIAKPIENIQSYRFSRIYGGFVYMEGLEYYYRISYNNKVSDVKEVVYRFPESFLLGDNDLSEEIENRMEEYKKELEKAEEDKAKIREICIKKALELLARNGVEV
jgi:hypothetical protein